MIVGVDAHTMAAHGPPVEPDAGKERSAVCLSDVMGDCPPEWTESARQSFSEAFAPQRVKLNDPFTGGYITRILSEELPFVQVENVSGILQELRIRCLSELA